jgi:hypothetical protein
MMSFVSKFLPVFFRSIPLPILQAHGIANCLFLGGILKKSSGLDNFFTSQKSNVNHLLAYANFELLRHDVTVSDFLTFANFQTLSSACSIKELCVYICVFWGVGFFCWFTI